MTRLSNQLAQAKARQLRTWTLSGALLLVAALSLTAPLQAAAPPVTQQAPAATQPEPETGPLLQADVVRSPVLGATRVLGASLATATPSYQALAALYAGEDQSLGVWSLEGPFSGRKGRVLIGTTSAFLTGFSPGDAPTLTTLLPELAVLRVGDHLDCWVLRDTDQVRPIPAIVLEAIQDQTGVYQGTLEADSYAQIVVMANYTSHKAFLKAAARDVSYGMLFHHPEEYRGRVIYVEGRLKRIERVAPMFEAAVEGVSDLYVGYIFNELYGANPYRVIFTEWPAGLSRDLLAAKIDHEVRVSFAGYFYKKYRYKAVDSKPNTSREAPMLIGHSLTFHSAKEKGAGAEEDTFAEGSSARYIVYAILGLLVGTVGTILGMAWWFRRTDAKVRSRILAARGDQFALPPPDAAPVAMPVPPVAAPVRPVRQPFPLRNNLPPGFGNRGEPPTNESGGGNEAEGSPDPDEGAGG